MKTEDIIKYALIAAGAYLVWEYVISPMMASAGTTTPATGTTAGTGTTTTQQTTSSTPASNVTPITTTPSSTPPALTPIQTSNLVGTLLTAAGGTSRLTIDQWAYYYNALPGKTAITPDQMAAMIAANGQITDANRGTYDITPDAFVALLQTQGLSGIVRIPQNIQQMGMGTVRGNFRNRPNAFSGAGGGSGRRTTIH